MKVAVGVKVSVLVGIYVEVKVGVEVRVGVFTGVCVCKGVAVETAVMDFCGVTGVKVGMMVGVRTGMAGRYRFCPA